MGGPELGLNKTLLKPANPLLTICHHMLLEMWKSIQDSSGGGRPVKIRCPLFHLSVCWRHGFTFVTARIIAAILKLEWATKRPPLHHLAAIVHDPFTCQWYGAGFDRQLLFVSSFTEENAFSPFQENY